MSQFIELFMEQVFWPTVPSPPPHTILLLRCDQNCMQFATWKRDRQPSGCRVGALCCGKLGGASYRNSGLQAHTFEETGLSFNNKHHTLTCTKRLKLFHFKLVSLIQPSHCPSHSLDLSAPNIHIYWVLGNLHSLTKVLFWVFYIHIKKGRSKVIIHIFKRERKQNVFTVIILSFHCAGVRDKAGCLFGCVLCFGKCSENSVSSESHPHTEDGVQVCFSELLGLCGVCCDFSLVLAG